MRARVTRSDLLFPPGDGYGVQCAALRGAKPGSWKCLKHQGENGYTVHMDEVAKLLSDMVETGTITDYAVFGAVAQMRYTEAVATLDADILVDVPEPHALDVLHRIYAFCEDRGYRQEGEAIRVGDWPVQFIPAFSSLTEAAIREAETGDLDGVPLRVVRADYLAVIALSVGRAKDFARILALRESGAVADEQISELAARYDLAAAWSAFLERFDES